MPRPPGQSHIYIVTPMINGGWRAECHHAGCGWWDDSGDEMSARIMIEQHRKSHRAPWTGKAEGKAEDTDVPQ
jgi:hypothetical protein